jgi:hypothetical protein
MRRNDYDVTDRICTTDVEKVGGEVLRLFRDLYEGAPGRAIERAFGDLSRLYNGDHPDYFACDTEYHDIQHVLDVTLAMARLMDGYERGREKAEPLPADCYVMGVVTALFHDFGYLRRRSDRRHRYGAEYTISHVGRGSRFLRDYFRRIGMKRLADTAARIVHFTGYERRAESIRVDDTLHRRIGHMLGTADILAQMADRCYLEKCRDRLYPEFVLGGLTRKRLANGRNQIVFRSGDDLVFKTPGFYINAAKRLDLQLARAYLYAERHFRGQNLYIEEIQKNVQYAEALAHAARTGMLRRTPPSTLQPEVQPYPEDLVIR